MEKLTEGNYPKQYGSIRRGDWRLRDLIAAGCNEEELAGFEANLWALIFSLAEKSSKIPESSDAFPGSRLLSRGWEWAVYSLPGGREVVKVPSGIFEEVNDHQYLENVREAYDLCKKHFPDYVADTHFMRLKTDNEGELNVLIQEDLGAVDEIQCIGISGLSESLRSNFRDFGVRVLEMIDEEEWVPDFQLNKDPEGNWWIANIAICNSKPIIYDFAVYYDPLRLYPERLKTDIDFRKQQWQAFVDELSGVPAGCI